MVDDARTASRKRTDGGLAATTAPGARPGCCEVRARTRVGRGARAVCQSSPIQSGRLTPHSSRRQLWPRSSFRTLSPDLSLIFGEQLLELRAQFVALD